MADLAINDKGDVLVHDGESWKPAQVAENDRGERVAFDGQSWKPVGSAAGARGQAKVGEANTAGNAFGNSFAQGGTLGFADELAAGVRSALPGVSNFMMSNGPLQREGDEQKPAQTVSTAPTFGERYTEELANIRAQQKKDEEEHPTATTAGKIAGNVATGALALPEFGAMSGAKMLGNALKFAGTGAALGGVQGFGEGEGGFSNRLSNAAPQALTGALVGGSIPVAGQLVQKALTTAPARAAIEKGVSPLLAKLADALDYVGPKVNPASLSAAAPEGGQIAADSLTTRLADSLRSAAGKTSDMGERAGIQQIALALERSKISPEEAAAKMKGLGDEGMLADLGSQFRSTAIGAKVLPGETRDLAEKVLTARNSNTPQRMISAAESGAPPPSSFALRGEGQAFDQHASAVGQQVYGEMAANKLRVSGEMQKIMSEAPDIGKAIQTELAQNKGTGTKLSPIELIDRVKQRLNRSADAAFQSGTVVNKADVGSLADRFERAFWEANPAAKEAAGAYAQAKSLPEHFDAGRNFLREGSTESGTASSAPALEDLLSGANPQQAHAARTGTVNTIREIAQGRNPIVRTNALARDIEQSPNIREKLATALAPVEGNAAAVERAARQTNTFAQTFKDVLKGSQTAEKLGDAAELGNTRLNITPHGITERITEHLKDVLGKIENPNEHVLNKIGEMVLTPDAMKNEEIIQALKKVLDARRRGTPVHAGAITATANQASP